MRTRKVARATPGRPSTALRRSSDSLTRAPCWISLPAQDNCQPCCGCKWVARSRSNRRRRCERGSLRTFRAFTSWTARRRRSLSPMAVWTRSSSGRLSTGSHRRAPSRRSHASSGPTAALPCCGTPRHGRWRRHHGCEISSGPLPTTRPSAPDTEVISSSLGAALSVTEERSRPYRRLRDGDYPTDLRALRPDLLPGRTDLSIHRHGVAAGAEGSV